MISVWGVKAINRSHTPCNNASLRFYTIWTGGYILYNTMYLKWTFLFLHMKNRVKRHIGLIEWTNHVGILYNPYGKHCFTLQVFIIIFPVGIWIPTRMSWVCNILHLSSDLSSLFVSVWVSEYCVAWNQILNIDNPITQMTL